MDFFKIFKFGTEIIEIYEIVVTLLNFFVKLLSNI